MSIIDPTKIKEVASSLANLLADTYALSLQIKFCHWNCVTLDFYSLHLMLDAHYEIVYAQTDVVAERIRALNFIAPGDFSSYASRTVVPELKVLPATGELIVTALFQAYNLVVDRARDLANLATEANDAGTNTLVADIILEYEKIMWQLNVSAIPEISGELAVTEQAAVS
jgi:starvation-inducible DNA-binding protein